MNFALVGRDHIARKHFQSTRIVSQLPLSPLTTSHHMMIGDFKYTLPSWAHFMTCSFGLRACNPADISREFQNSWARSQWDQTLSWRKRKSIRSLNFPANFFTSPYLSFADHTFLGKGAFTPMTFEVCPFITSSPTTTYLHRSDDPAKRSKVSGELTPSSYSWLVGLALPTAQGEEPHEQCRRGHKQILLSIHNTSPIQAHT